ncbi:TIGR04206 family protein [Halovenus sp. WSH3]|uniref:TIGR04206 family protein n=1 Tax=Halovenus carboxidivorans TaxID=2692199 RepID=A0A6B0SYH3_9EURY|nr:TIGR04206 family protein [Halovenus carboxidivorans]MXR50818.1 TIGR04206 family protein [Halovenus carboxidivorans]
MWVRSEYAGELAVLSTWLCGLAPWAVTWIARGEATGYFFWFHAINLLFTPGLNIPGERPLWVWGFLEFSVYTGETYATYLWLAGTGVFGVALGLSVAYYVAEERIQSLTVDPVKILGGLLVASAVLLGGACVLLVRNHLGTTVPVGVVLQVVLGVILLRTERIERSDDATAQSA